ncbi:hypothetical protein AVEN_85408-1 [Araneus ventricosus]|uniref:Uncharacterized protein n=1 Tax=Araneus ventricosus TaxID=182803 RepID=A0A4Y2FFR7_ARAVE|nr:hypothetical protein AVEN_85408-1 [Araneus ventricosus]
MLCHAVTGGLCRYQPLIPQYTKHAIKIPAQQGKAHKKFTHQLFIMSFPSAFFHLFLLVRQAGRIDPLTSLPKQKKKELNKAEKRVCKAADTAFLCDLHTLQRKRRGHYPRGASRP